MMTDEELKNAVREMIDLSAETLRDMEPTPNIAEAAIILCGVLTSLVGHWGDCDKSRKALNDEQCNRMCRKIIDSMESAVGKTETLTAVDLMVKILAASFWAIRNKVKPEEMGFAE